MTEWALIIILNLARDCLYLKLFMSCKYWNRLVLKKILFLKVLNSGMCNVFHCLLGSYAACHSHVYNFCIVFVMWKYHNHNHDNVMWFIPINNWIEYRQCTCVSVCSVAVQTAQAPRQLRNEGNQHGPTPATGHAATDCVWNLFTLNIDCEKRDQLHHTYSSKKSWNSFWHLSPTGSFTWLVPTACSATSITRNRTRNHL